MKQAIHFAAELVGCIGIMMGFPAVLYMAGVAAGVN